VTQSVRRFQDTHGGTIRDALLARGLVCGRLRWLALRCGWDLPFTKLGPERSPRHSGRDCWNPGAMDGKNI